jgi:hypothetical protein
MSWRDWAVWNLDGPTIWVYLLLLQFAALEILTSGGSPIESWRDQMVTDHFRQVFHAAPITWYLGVALWLWLGPHFFWPALESWIARMVGGG